MDDKMAEARGKMKKGSWSLRFLNQSIPSEVMLGKISGFIDMYLTEKNQVIMKGI